MEKIFPTSLTGAAIRRSTQASWHFEAEQEDKQKNGNKKWRVENSKSLSFSDSSRTIFLTSDDFTSKC